VKTTTTTMAWVKGRVENLSWCVAVVTTIASVACGYSKIRESQVESELQMQSLARRCDRIEQLLDKVLDMHLGAVQGASVAPRVASPLPDVVAPRPPETDVAALPENPPQL
jgi:hypothetical protein